MPGNPDHVGDPGRGYPLLQALQQRRSRRFCAGMELPAGPMAYRSRYRPEPLTPEQESLMVYAAAGVSGPALADLAFAQGQGGNIMAGLVGRTVASGDGIQTVALVVTNDSGTWFVRRPQDLSPSETTDLIQMSAEGRYREAYERSRVQLSEQRAAPPKDPLFNIRANQWSAYAPGTTCLLPVNDLTFMYVNGLLEILNEETAAFLVDERNRFQPAGLGAFAKSRGGHLLDHPRDGRVATIQQVETMVTEFVAIEQGMVAQNLGLMAQALGLGGFPFFANHPFGWFQALGFRMSTLSVGRYLGAGILTRAALKLLRREVEVPLPIGLEHRGQVLLRAYAPPYFPSMSAAVDAVLAAKLGANGALKRSGANSLWKDSPSITASIPRISESAIRATKAYCEYVWGRYGRFPAYLPPFRTIVSFQTGRLDLEFYERFYHPGAISESHREDFATWSKAQLQR